MVVHRTVTVVWTAGIQRQWTSGRRLGLRQVAPAHLWQQVELASIQVCHSCCRFPRLRSQCEYRSRCSPAVSGHVTSSGDRPASLLSGAGVFAVDAESLIHICTVYFVQPNRTGRSGDPSSEWPLP